MTVKLIVQADVKGASQVNKLNAGLRGLGNQSLIAKKKLQLLQATAARSKATFAALGTTLKVGVGVGLAAVTLGIGKFVKDTFAAGKLTESLQVRFKLLFNSATEGGKAFQVMNKFAAKVPFSLEAIAAGSGNLAVISKDAGELNKILEVTGNVAAATGLDFAQTATQIQRSFAGGIASADIFRERGVRAMLGFQAGATVSIEETKKRFFEVFANGGQYSKATKEFETTLEANVSFVQDAYFRFRQAAAEPLFGGVKAQLVELVGDFKENDAQLKILATRIGKSLSKGFENLGKFIKLVVDNFYLLSKAIKLFIAIKVVVFVGELAKAMVFMAGSIKIATKSMYALGVAFRLNPVGIIITALQIGIVAWVAFGDEIKAAAKYIKDTFLMVMDKADLAIRKFWETLGIGNDDNFQKIQELESKINGITSRWNEASEAKFAYMKGSRFDDNTKAIEKSIKDQNNAYAENRRMQVQNVRSRRAVSQEKELAESFKTKFRMRMKNGEGYTGSNAIDGDKPSVNSDAHVQLHAEKLKQIKEYRAQLSLVGIDSKKIGGIIGDTWLEGIKQGNSLLETTKNAFKNVLVSISDTIVKRSAELLVERIFNSLIDQRIMKQKTLNAATAEQGNIMSSLVSKAGSLFSMGGGGGGSKWGSLLSAGMSLFGGGGGGSNLMGIGSAKGFFGMNKGGVVPGGAPYTDRVPTMLTPGEVVIPRNKVNEQSGGTNITNINISGNVDQRSIEQIKAVIAQSSAEVGGANRTFQSNTRGVRGRNT